MRQTQTVLLMKKGWRWMAEKRANQSMAYRREPERYYIDGNTARRLNEQPETPKRRNKAVQPRPKQRTVQHKKRVSVFALKYTLFLVTSVGIILAACFMYLHSSSVLKKNEQAVTALQSQLQTVQEQNNSLKESLNKTIDLDEIYQIATGRLGMVYAGEDQVIYYDSSNNDYIRQYESIPGGK